MTVKCEFERETWGPHEGCREFMDEPEVWTCSAEATRVFTVVEGPTIGERRLVCVEHATEMAFEEASGALGGISLRHSPLPAGVVGTCSHASPDDPRGCGRLVTVHPSNPRALRHVTDEGAWIWVGHYATIERQSEEAGR